MKLFGTTGQKFHCCPGTTGQRDKLKILPRDGTGRDFDKLSRPVPGRPGTISILFCTLIADNCIFLMLFLSFLSRGTSRDGTGQAVKIPSRPVPWQDFELVPLSLCPGTRKELLSLCPEKFQCPVPLETLIHTEYTEGLVTHFFHFLRKMPLKVRPWGPCGHLREVKEFG